MYHQDDLSAGMVGARKSGSRAVRGVRQAALSVVCGALLLGAALGVTVGNAGAARTFTQHVSGASALASVSAPLDIIPGGPGLP